MASKRADIKAIVKEDMEKRDLPIDPDKQIDPDGKEDKQPPGDPMTIFSIRLPKSQKDILQAHFKNDLGLDLSPGIRMLITKYMKEHRL